MNRTTVDSKWSLKVVAPESQVWLDLLGKSSHLVFHEAEWAEAMSLAGRRILCAVFLWEDEVKGGFMGVKIGFSICRVGYCNVPYGGFLGERPQGEVLFGLLREFGSQQGLARLQFVDFPGSGLVAQSGFEVVEDYTDRFRLKGQDVESLPQGYRRQLRQDLKKLRAAGVEVQSEDGKAGLQVLHHCYLQTMKAKGGIARYELSWLTAVQKSLGRRCQVLVAKKGEQELGAMMIVDSKHCAHGLMLASDPAGPISSVNKILLDTALQEALARGMEFFDYMPSGKSASGVSHFKKLFGGERVVLQHEMLVVNSLGNWIWKRLYQVAGSFPGRLLLHLKRKLTSK